MLSQSVQRDIEAFRNSIEPFRDQWRSLDIRVIAMKEKEKAESPFQNAAATIKLSPLLPHEAEAEREVDLPNLPWLKAIHEVRPIAELALIRQNIFFTDDLKT